MSPTIRFFLARATASTPGARSSCCQKVRSRSGVGRTASLATPTSSAGYASLPFVVPNSPSLTGAMFSTQAGVLSSGIDITNAIDFSIL